LSVLAVHDRFICVVEIVVADTPVGVEGGIVSALVRVVISVALKARL
jgi:hypothetical protein